jgi:hypothetical protein
MMKLCIASLVALLLLCMNQATAVAVDGRVLQVDEDDADSIFLTNVERRIKKAKKATKIKLPKDATTKRQSQRRRKV